MTALLRTRGFSLIEVLIVLSIVSILFAMGFATLGRERRSSAVEAEAERLAATLRLTRNMAMNEQTGYGVAFNIRNGVGTSGAVLNNWDGGHYYRIIGPNRIYRELPIPRGGASLGFGNNKKVKLWHNFPRFLDDVRQCWVSEPQRLPARSVRFLALSDLDRGPRLYRPEKGGWNDVYYDVDSSYPRPWFGVYDQSTGTLWPWGGYDPSKDYSGFYYEGNDGDISGSVNPSDRIYNEDFDNNKTFADIDLNGDLDSDDPYEREVNYTIWEKDQGRELVNADWLDACVVFLPTGEAMFLEWNLARRLYLAEQIDAVDESKKFRRNGVNDRCMRKMPGINAIDKNGNYGMAFNTSATAHARNTDQPESQHFVVHTGGWHITLAPDADVDSNQFNTVDEAIESITPAYRVYVGASGAVRVFRVQSRRSGSFLDSRPTWPASPTVWQDPTTIKKFHETGWLHEEGTTDPMGEPIVDKITGRMLTERIWWFSD